MKCGFVLLVEDDGDVRDSIRDLLALEGHHVVAVENGEQAIGAVAVATPLAVVTDLSMPRRDGHSLIAHLRANARTHKVPICVVSGEPSAAPEGTIALGKPFEFAALSQALRRALSK